MKIFRTPPACDPIVRAEWHGNKYDVPRSWTQPRAGRRDPLAVVCVIVAAVLVGWLIGGV